MQPEAFTAAAGELVDQVMQMADNVGATDKHPRVELPGRSLSGNLRQDGRTLCSELNLDWPERQLFVA